MGEDIGFVSQHADGVARELRPAHGSAGLVFGAQPAEVIARDYRQTRKPGDIASRAQPTHVLARELRPAQGSAHGARSESSAAIQGFDQACLVYIRTQLMTFHGISSCRLPDLVWIRVWRIPSSRCNSPDVKMYIVQTFFSACLGLFSQIHLSACLSAGGSSISASSKIIFMIYLI